ncbi:retropepsin-like aspartic protease family protein [Consotaella aegiceratis]|uniref:retropepsin-like aspartic protease family protein n=1 Tax=Consotaella aegiceratis TaxID=3097961 RepID=UPI002F3FF235
MRRGSLLFLLVALLIVGGLLLVLDGDGMIGGLRDGDFAQLLRLSAWGLFLGAGLVILLQTRLTHVVRSAAIWALVFAVLIGLYSFRSKFVDLGERILAAVIPGRTATLSNGEVLVTRGADNQFAIDAVVNGTPLTFLVDTGASTVAIDRRAAAHIGIDVEALRFDTRVVTANGIASAAPVWLDTVRIGDIERRNVRAAVTSGEIGLSLLGMSFLSSLESVEIRGDQMILSD